MSTKGIVDIVFCLDVSDSMKPCIDAVRRHAVDFISGLQPGPQQRMDWRIDFVAHSCDVEGTVHRLASLRKGTIPLMEALYRSHDAQAFFTSNLDEFRRALEAVQVAGDEATLLALDTALDFPWRPRNRCHRVVICLTDEPFETGAALALQKAQLPALLDKIQKLGVMLFLVAPESEVYMKLAEVDKSEYEVVEQANDGLRSVQFDKVLSFIGKSISAASLQVAGEDRVSRALFNQDKWVAIDAPLRGR